MLHHSLMVAGAGLQISFDKPYCFMRHFLLLSAAVK